MMHTTRKRHARADAGFSLVELMIGMLILSLLSASLIGAMRGLTELGDSGGVQAELSNMGERAMQQLTLDLKRSGFANVGGTNYPHLFEDGAAEGVFVQHAHVPATTAAAPGDPDFGPSREIVLLQPRDADGDSVPDIGADGFLIWDPVELALVLVTGADGVNVLQRRTSAGVQRPLARHVERVTFDDNASSGFEVPLDAVRVRLSFRKQDSKGTVHRHEVERIVRLRNGR
jgi:prepilin-type N-terminal cleavage/methylation domain-containing protein